MSASLHVFVPALRNVSDATPTEPGVITAGTNCETNAAALPGSGAPVTTMVTFVVAGPNSATPS